MKAINYYSTSLVMITISFGSFAQNQSPDLENKGINYSRLENSSEHPCITMEEYALLEKRCSENRIALHLNSPSESTSKSITPLQEWPVRASVNMTDCSFYFIGAYVDQNQTAGSIQDFNCGTNTYDGHKGTDIATWPFGFYKMDNNLVEIQAAAPGIILDKHDGEFDRNCAGNNLTANYVIIQHANGSTALYWHMKMNSVTSKSIGESVLAGEYLGVVGSSGSSSGPHVHFEIWEGATSATRVDPFSGNCNSLNATSWWTNQKQHKETAVIKTSVNTTDIAFQPCPITDTPNESNVFQIPFQGAGLPAGYAKFYMFLREEINGLTGTMKIKNPNGSTYLTWNYTSTADHKINSWGWSKLLPTTSGVYTFEVNYNGTICSTTFEIVGIAGIDDNNSLTKSQIFPNPSNGNFILEFDNTLGNEFELFNLFGQKVYQNTLTDSKTEFNINVAKGIYQYVIKDQNAIISNGKLMIE